MCILISLTLSTLGKIFSRWLSYFSHKTCLHWRQFAWNVITCFFVKNIKNIINLSSAELLQRMVKINKLVIHTWLQTRLQVFAEAKLALVSLSECFHSPANRTSKCWNKKHWKDFRQVQDSNPWLLNKFLISKQALNLQHYQITFPACYFQIVNLLGFWHCMVYKMKLPSDSWSITWHVPSQGVPCLWNFSHSLQSLCPLMSHCYWPVRRRISSSVTSDLLHLDDLQGTEHIFRDAKATHIFQQKISEYCILNPLKQLTKWPLTSLLS